MTFGDLLRETRRILELPEDLRDTRVFLQLYRAARIEDADKRAAVTAARERYLKSVKVK